MLFIKFFLLLFIYTNIFSAQYGTIFASSNLRFVFPEMIDVFYKTYPNADVHIQYEGSGTLAKEILDGKNYDLFLAANMKYPQIIYNNKKAITPPKVYIQGKIVLYIPKKFQNDKTLWKVLTQPNIKTIFIANKKSAPYGVASIEVLKYYKIYDKVKHKIIYTSDIATAVYKLLWNNEVGFVPKSALLFFADRDSKNNSIDIDQKAYNPIIQGYVFSKEGIKNQNATKFLNFLLSKKGQEIFKKYGYVSPFKTK